MFSGTPMPVPLRHAYIGPSAVLDYELMTNPPFLLARAGRLICANIAPAKGRSGRDREIELPSGQRGAILAVYASRTRSFLSPSGSCQRLRGRQSLP